MLTEDKINTRSFVNSLIELKVYFDESMTKRKMSLSLNRLKSDISYLLSPYQSEDTESLTADVDKLAQLLDIFYRHLEFKGVDSRHSTYSDYLDIDLVLKDKKGYDFVLIALFTSIAKEHGINASSVFFRTDIDKGGFNG